MDYSIKTSDVSLLNNSLSISSTRCPPCLSESLQDVPHGVVHLAHGVTVAPGLGTIVELRAGELREVDVVEGEVEEEGLAGLDGVCDEGLGLLRHPGGEAGEVHWLLYYLVSRVERTGTGEGVGGDGVTVSARVTVARSEGTHIVTVGQPEVLGETLTCWQKFSLHSDPQVPLADHPRPVAGIGQHLGYNYNFILGTAGTVKPRVTSSRGSPSRELVINTPGYIPLLTASRPEPV